MGVVALGGLVLRLAYVLAVRDELTGDGFYYHQGANLLADGKGFINPLVYVVSGQEVASAFHPPAWLVVLSVPALLGFRTFLEQQIFACLVGTATIVVIGFAGRRVAGGRAGLIAAAIAALYPNLWLYERELLSETLAFFLVALVILLALRFRDGPTPLSAVALGALCGVLVLTRSEQIMLLGLLLVPLVVFASSLTWWRRIGLLALAGSVAVVVIAPWAIYNTSRFEEPVLLSTQFGNTLAAANCDAVYYGEFLGYREPSCSRQIGVQGRDEAATSGDASTTDEELRRQATDYIRDNKTRLPVVVMAREGRVWGLFRPFQQMHLDQARRTGLWVIRLGFFAYWLHLAAAVVGAVILFRRHAPVWPLLVFVVIVAVSVAITFGQTRYRAPAEVPIVLLAAVAVDGMARSRAPTPQ
ncbi:MAG: glycosyltransferase family 39 protein [Acidimicrobiia bacterium]